MPASSRKSRICDWDVVYVKRPIRLPSYRGQHLEQAVMDQTETKLSCCKPDHSALRKCEVSQIARKWGS